MKNPSWLKNAIFYEIYPQSFYDSNNDGVGDLNGISQKLDYIKELGCNALWLNPIFDSPFKDAGYDVRDYYKVASRYGSNDDLYNLIKECHKRGIHILLDLVPCHTSEEHEWFQKSSLAEHNEFSDRYVWTHNAFDKGNGNPFVGGEAPRNGCYAISFFNCQPCLNYGYYKKELPWQHALDDEEPLKTREAIKDVIKFYLDKGIDGYRVDMAACLVRNDHNEEGTMYVWENIFKDIKSKYPEAAFVSEWATPHRAIKCGFDMDFTLDHGWDGGNGYHHLFRDHIEDMDGNLIEDKSTFKLNSTQDFSAFLNEYLFEYNSIKDDGYFCFLTDNHDMIRIKEFYTNEELKLIYSFMFMMPGCPFLYYGDEIGMNYLHIPTKEGGYMRTGSRTPMQWDNSLNKGFSKVKDKSKLYLPVEEDKSSPSVENALNDKDSLYYLFKELILLRQNNEELQSINNFEVYYSKFGSKLFAFTRGSFLIVVNPSNNEYELNLIDDYKIIKIVGNKSNIVDNTLKVAKASFTLLKK